MRQAEFVAARNEREYLQELEDRFLQRVLLIVLKGFRLEVAALGLDDMQGEVAPCL